VASFGGPSSPGAVTGVGDEFGADALAARTGGNVSVVI